MISGLNKDMIVMHVMLWNLIIKDKPVEMYIGNNIYFL